MERALHALQRLRDGNARFLSGPPARDVLADRDRLRALSSRQDPGAIILGCADSRVPAEIVFDQGLGDLFVIRVAGNIVAPSLVGSVEFAATRYGTPLVVVLGHSRCGAVMATLEELQRPTADQSRNLRSIVDRIRPAVEGLLHTDLTDDPDELLREAVRANIRASAGQLRHGSQVLEQLIGSDRLLVVGAEYSLETGEVDFFDGIPGGF
jgi:carbonic anhydrase